MFKYTPEKIINERITFGRNWILLVVLADLILWGLFKWYYVNPNMVLDTYYYVSAAAEHKTVNIWPIGYSWFILAAGIISRSAWWLVTLQWVIMIASSVYFLHTIRQIFSITGAGMWCMGVFLFLNPIFFYTCNMVMADALFCSVSLLWFTQLLLILNRPRKYLLVTQALLLLIAFTVRYNAMYYPVIAGLALVFSKYKLWEKVIGMAVTVILLAAFIGFTSHEMQRVSGVKQFSPFGSWKLANNAIYVYGNVYEEDHRTPPPAYAGLHDMVRGYFSGHNFRPTMLTQEFSNGSYYMFASVSPLKQYMYSKVGADSSLINFQKFAPFGPLYSQYAMYLIREYPMAYINYFVYPNIWRYLYPPKETYGSSSGFFMRAGHEADAARSWFGITSLTAPMDLILLRLKLLAPYPVIFMGLHLLFIFCLLGYLVLGCYRTADQLTRKALLGMILIWLSDFVFNVSVSGVVLRYLLFPAIIELACIVVFVRAIWIQPEKAR